jgi:hypothetical protein
VSAAPSGDIHNVGRGVKSIGVSALISALRRKYIGECLALHSGFLMVGNVVLLRRKHNASSLQNQPYQSTASVELKGMTHNQIKRIHKYYKFCRPISGNYETTCKHSLHVSQIIHREAEVG